MNEVTNIEDLPQNAKVVYNVSHGQNKLFLINVFLFTLILCWTFDTFVYEKKAPETKTVYKYHYLDASNCEDGDLNCFFQSPLIRVETSDIEKKFRPRATKVASVEWDTKSQYD